MLHFRLVPVLWFSVITSCMIVEKYVYTATRNAAVSPIEVCFWVKRGGSRSCTTFENLTALNEFMSTPYVKVEIHDQVLTKVHKYSFSPVMYTKELVIRNCGVVEIEAGAFNNSLSLLKFDVQKNKLEIVRTGTYIPITHCYCHSICFNFRCFQWTINNPFKLSTQQNQNNRTGSVELHAKPRGSYPIE